MLVDEEWWNHVKEMETMTQTSFFGDEKSKAKYAHILRHGFGPKTGKTNIPSKEDIEDPIKRKIHQKINTLEHPKKAVSYILDDSEDESEDQTEELAQYCKEMKQDMDEMGNQDNTIAKQETFHELYNEKEKLKRLIKKHDERDIDMLILDANNMADRLGLTDPRDRNYVFEKYDAKLAKDDVKERLKIKKLMQQMEIDDMDEQQQENFLEQELDKDRTKDKWVKLKSRS